MKSLLFLVCLIFLAESVKFNSLQNDCGGNCIPTEDGKGCSQCPCGSIPNYINIKQKCGQYFWNQYCCNCIIMNLSQGNEKASFVIQRALFQQKMYAGIFLFEIQSKYHQLCDADFSFERAFQLYTSGGYAWNRVAKTQIVNQCGCSIPG